MTPLRSPFLDGVAFGLGMEAVNLLGHIVRGIVRLRARCKCPHSLFKHRLEPFRCLLCSCGDARGTIEETEKLG